MPDSRGSGAAVMRVMLTVNAAWNVWNFRRPLVEALAGDGHVVTVLAPPDDAVPELERLGCRVRPLEMSVKGLNPLEDLRLQRRFGRIFREERPDAVLSYTIKNNIFGARAAKPAGVPFLPNVTGLGTAFLSGRLLQTLTEQLYRRSFANLPVVFFQNEDDRDLFLERRLVRSGQARLLPGSGIDLKHFAPAPMPAPGEPPVFLMIARLLRDKGVVEFVEAARRVRARHPGARFQLLGAVASENRTAIDHATLKAWVAEGVVEYLGTTTDVRPAIAASTCVVLPSYREGAPRTLIEAAAMARPLIATDVPGCRAVVDRDQSGFLCEVRSADSLAATIERFLALPPGAQQAMGAAGRAKMEREYDQALVVDAYRSALEVVAGGRRGTH
jgi:glycosyltransferase involved in cell wall biosynthesis